MNSAQHPTSESRRGAYAGLMEQARPGLRESGYPTPEQAALASYSPAAGAFVVHVTAHGFSAEVAIDTEPSHPSVTTCLKGRYGLWYERKEPRS